MNLTARLYQPVAAFWAMLPLPDRVRREVARDLGILNGAAQIVQLAVLTLPTWAHVAVLVIGLLVQVTGTRENVTPVATHSPADVEQVADTDPTRPPADVPQVDLGADPAPRHGPGA